MSKLEEYKHRRAELIASEKALRFDAEAISNATNKERHASEVVGALRIKEVQTIWDADYEKQMYPGMEFLTAKETILSTKLYEIIRKMPKGGLLHVHIQGVGDAKFLLQTTLKYPQIHVRVCSAASQSGLPPPQFKPFSPDMCAKYTNVPSLTSPEYVPGSWVPLHKARNEFAYGGPEGFDKWVVGAMTISPKEAYVDFNTSAKIWERFTSTFGVASSMIRYEPIAKWHIRQTILSAIDDGISYVELRVGFFRQVGFREDGSETLEPRDYLIWFGEAIQAVKDQMKAENREEEFVGAKIIYTSIRSRSNQALIKYLEDCMALKEEFPDLVAGFDIMGQEDIYSPLIYHAEPLLWFQEECKRRKLDIPFVFHAGETLDDGGAADSNLYDALLLGTKRIGHGFSLAKHPLLMQMCKERGVALEVCPISNEILRLASSMPMHPLPILLNNGVPIALSSDNPAVFGNVGVIVASEATNLLSLKQLARQSLEHSLLSAEDKKKAIQLWEKRWDAYIEDIVGLTDLPE
ncbi:unnamed protein product [Rhizoctonia solani]|uniref:adenosine deaminase n=1 Tax=Rhizoctonia solani TaxID=456999 RepID=A0A8H3GVA2_9AGAM|nr:unnamed protein product [Rhizoctonia solani]